MTKRMKWLGACVMALVVVMALGSLAVAETAGAREKGPMAGPGRGPLPPFAQDLNLTAEQQEKARAIFENLHQQMQQIAPVEKPAEMVARRGEGARPDAGVRKGPGEGPRMGRGEGPGAGGPRGEGPQGMNLTDEQKTKIQAIREESRAKADAIRDNDKLTEKEKRAQFEALRAATQEQERAILTPEQQKQMGERKGRMAGDRMGGPQGKQLTEEQQAKMKAAHEKAMADFRAILTPEQQEKFDQIVKERGPGRGPGFGPGPGPRPGPPEDDAPAPEE